MRNLLVRLLRPLILSMRMMSLRLVLSLSLYLLLRLALFNRSSCILHFHGLHLIGLNWHSEHLRKLGVSHVESPLEISNFLAISMRPLKKSHN